MADHRLKAHDLLPSIEGTLGYEGSVLVPTLSEPGTSVYFVMKGASTAAGGPALPPPLLQKAAVIVDGSTATVRYDWELGDTTVPGKYLGEFEVHYPSGKVQTFPTTSYIEIDIIADLDEAGI